MRAWCHWLSLDCCHSQAVSTRKLPYVTGSGFPFLTLCLLKTGASLITDKWHEILKVDHPHTLPLVCYFLNTPAEQRGGTGTRSAPAGDLCSPIPLTNYQPQRQEMRHNRNILRKVLPSQNEKSRLHLQSAEEKYFLKCLI